MTGEIRHDISSLITDSGKIEDLDATFDKHPINDFVEEAGKAAYWIIYNQNEVLLGKDINEMPKASREFAILKIMRIFSAKAEFHIWKYGEDFWFRLREDGKGTPSHIYVTEHFRLDTEKEVDVMKKNKKYAMNSGIKLCGSLAAMILPNKYRVHNYFEYDESGCIKFTDARLVDFVARNGA